MSRDRHERVPSSGISWISRRLSLSFTSPLIDMHVPTIEHLTHTILA